MRVLGIDVSTKLLTIGICDDLGLNIGLERDSDRKHSADLVPAIDELLKMCGFSFEAIDGFSLSIGPGSFTGLRVGLTTVKGFAHATGKPVCGIPTLDVLAHNALNSHQVICPILDARRNQVYACLYRSKNGKLKRLTDYLLLPIDELLKRIKQPTLFLGDGLELYEKEIARQKKGKAKFAPQRLWFPKGMVVAYLGLQRLKSKDSDDPFKLKPMYLYSRECMVKK